MQIIEIVDDSMTLTEFHCPFCGMPSFSRCPRAEPIARRDGSSIGYGETDLLGIRVEYPRKNLHCPSALWNRASIEEH